jgi:hypothetical protein
LTKRAVAGHGPCTGAVSGAVFVSAGVITPDAGALGFAGDSGIGTVASTTGLSAVTVGVCARADMTANILTPSIVNEATTFAGDLKPSMNFSFFSSTDSGQK